MNDLLLITLGVVGFMLIVLVLAGVMIVATYMELPALKENLSRLSARITGKTTFQDGCVNCRLKLIMLEDLLAQLSTKNTGQQTLQNNLRVSHLECWCNSSRKQATNSGPEENRSGV